MKKLVTLICALVIGSMSFAQKNEIKAIESAIKNSDYATAKSSIAAAEALLSSMDDKTKDKFYYLKAQSLNAGGAISQDDIDPAMKAIDDLMSLNEKTGKSKFLEETLAIKNQIFGTIATRAKTFFESKQYEAAGKNYEKAYTLSKKDTLFLYAAATAYLNGQKFDKSLPLYEKLLEMDYEGSGLEYIAIDKENGKEESFASEQTRDLAVRSGQYISPKNKKLPSKKGDILRYMSLIYSFQGNSTKALELISDAKKYNPNDMQLVIAEAKAYLANGEQEKIKTLLNEAKTLAGDNPVNLYNLGFYAMESKEYDIAKDYFEKAIEADPKFADAYLNLANIITTEEESIVKEMNSLGTSAADDKRYNELRDKKVEVLKRAIPYLEKAFELKPNEATGKFLISVYSASFQNKKANELKEKLASMPADGN